MFPKLLSTALLLTFGVSAFAQTTPLAKTPEDDEKFKKEIIEFLRDTSVDVGRMRSMENRISFNAELASLMWFQDEKEARGMYAVVVGDFKQLIVQFDSLMNAIEMPTDDDEFSGGIFGGFGRSPVQRKFRIAMAVRQQIAMSLAEHEPDMAFSFFYDSAGLISNPEFKKENEQSDKHFEFQLMTQIAQSNASKAAQFGMKSMKDGLDNNHIELLKKIYGKDPEKGIEFGAAILSKIKSDRKEVKNLYFFSNLLSFGSQNLEDSLKPGAKKAIYSKNDLRDIADLFAQLLLDGTNDGEGGSAVGYADQIEKYAPGRGVQIRAKFRNASNATNSMERAVANAMMAAGDEEDGPPPPMTANSNSTPAQRQADKEARDKAEKQLFDDVKGLGTKSLPKDERDKVIAQSRKIISQTPGKDKKITALSMLAAQVARFGDKELADEIMRDAERLVNPQPKNFRDFLFSWMLAAGYAEANPDKAFPILESTILRANETISAFVKVAEFIDINEELIDDGEIQVGMFGGSMIRGMTGDLGIANTTLRSLVKADFAKTRGLTNSFDRIETRVLAKMLVLRAILDEKKQAEKGKELTVESIN